MNQKEQKSLKIKLEFILDNLDYILDSLEDFPESIKEEIEDKVKTSINEIFDIGVFFNLRFTEKYLEKYQKNYIHGFILRELFLSFNDKFLDEDSYSEGISKIEEFMSDFDKFHKFLESKLNKTKIEIVRLRDFIENNKIN